MSENTVALVVRRTIDAPAARLFEAWTRPEQLRQWWGPKGVRCVDAEVDLRVGGRYRIVNELPDRSLVTIEGTFEIIENPRKLVYTWQIPPAGPLELVTVCFEARGDMTEVIVTHDKIATQPMRDSHERGWEGCLDGLTVFAPAPA